MTVNRNIIRTCLIIFLISIFYIPLTKAQQALQGSIFYKYYSPKSYNASPHNWYIAQDDDGAMYFANSKGILKYDGTTWTYISHPMLDVVRSLYKGSDGKIYVGSKTDIGYLDKDKHGASYYISLSDLLPDSCKQFTNVWTVYETPDGIVFPTQKHFIFYKNKQVKIHTNSPIMEYGFVANNTLFSQDINGYLYSTTLANGSRFADSALALNGSSIYCMTDGFTKNEVLLMPFRHGIYKLNTQTNHITKFKTDVDSVFETATQYWLIKLKNGNIAISTYLHGIFILDKNGKLVEHIFRKDGLKEDNVYFIYEDAEQNLWVTSSDGIYKYDLNNPVRYYNDLHGIKTASSHLKYWNNKWHLFTLNSIQYFKDGAFAESGKFRNRTADVVQYGNDLLLATDNGLFLYNTNYEYKGIRINPAIKTLNVNASNIAISKDNRVFVSSTDNIYELTNKNNKLQLDTFLPCSAKGEITNLEVDSENNLWANSLIEGLIKVNLKTLAVKKYSEKEILGEDPKSVGFFNLDGAIYLESNTGLLKYNKQKDAFEQSPDFGPNLSYDLNDVYYARITKSRDKIFYLKDMYEGNRSLALNYKLNGKWYTESKTFADISSVHVGNVLLHKDSFITVHTNENVYVYQLEKGFRQPLSYKTIITAAIVNQDTLLYQNSSYDLSAYSADFKMAGKLFFSYSALTYKDEERIEYSYFLENFSEQWSPWSKVSFTEFSNLYEGNYVFKVKARNHYGDEGAVTAYTFTILPPWYRSWWAYTLYVFGLCAFVYALVRWNSAKLRKRNELLEVTVKNRTKDIEAQKEIIAGQKELVEEKNKEIVDSINYAKRIQAALLTSEKYIQKYLPEFFILYKPKDIVSGDFYWAFYHQPSHSFYLVTADCTGHGVPGAFMSMLGINFLNEIVGERNILKPDEILNELRKEIIKALNPEDSVEESKDGMDAVVCRYLFNEQTIQFAASNNPLWLVAADKNEIIREYKADKFPVGKYGDIEKPFTFNEIPIISNNWLITFTDGYADQFGGERGKKFKYKQLESLLQQNSHLSAAELKLKLDKAFEDWKHNYEQVDDVLIIGVKL